MGVTGNLFREYKSLSRGLAGWSHSEGTGTRQLQSQISSQGSLNKYVMINILMVYAKILYCMNRFICSDRLRCEGLIREAMQRSLHGPPNVGLVFRSFQILLKLV